MKTATLSSLDTIISAAAAVVIVISVSQSIISHVFLIHSDNFLFLSKYIDVPSYI